MEGKSGSLKQFDFLLFNINKKRHLYGAMAPLTCQSIPLWTSYSYCSIFIHFSNQSEKSSLGIAISYLVVFSFPLTTFWNFSYNYYVFFFLLQEQAEVSRSQILTSPIIQVCQLPRFCEIFCPTYKEFIGIFVIMNAMLI